LNSEHEILWWYSLSTRRQLNNQGSSSGLLLRQFGASKEWMHSRRHSWRMPLLHKVFEFAPGAAPSAMISVEPPSRAGDDRRQTRKGAHEGSSRRGAPPFEPCTSIPGALLFLRSDCPCRGFCQGWQLHRTS
jgi:hypothetical protein